RLVDALQLAPDDRVRLIQAAPSPSRGPRRPGPSGDVPTPAPPPTDTTAERTTRLLPAPRTSFVGRADSLTKARDNLATWRLMTVVGAGGVGKTRFATELARLVADDYRDGVHLVELSAVDAVDAVADAMARALGVWTTPQHT